MGNVSGHSNFKGVDIAELCEEFGELDLMKKENASGNDTDYVLQAIARYNSVESDTEDGKIPFTVCSPLACADPEGGQEVRTPLKNHKNIGALSNTDRSQSYQASI